jgi:hypothetical protein
MTEAGAKLLRIPLTQLRHVARLHQSLFGILPSGIMLANAIHLAQLILRAELNAVERGLHHLIIQLCGSLQSRLQLCLQAHCYSVGNGCTLLGQLRHFTYPLLGMIELHIDLRLKAWSRRPLHVFDKEFDRV